MIFFITMPLWLGLILFVIHCAAAAGKQHAPAMVQRTITAPDGRVVTMVVPATELAAVSIARLYPAGKVPDGKPDPAPVAPLLPTIIRHPEPVISARHVRRLGSSS